MASLGGPLIDVAVNLAHHEMEWFTVYTPGLIIKLAGHFPVPILKPS